MTTATDGAATAHVELLTASVHVLQIGSRQITLSVAKQLDHVNRNDMEPMGRVNLGKDGNGFPFYGNPLIGKDLRSGALVLAPMDQTWGEDRIPNTKDPLWVDDLPRNVTICVSQKPKYDAFLVEFRGVKVEIPSRLVDGCGIDGHERTWYEKDGQSCEHWSTNGQDDVIIERMADSEARRDYLLARVRSDAALPLIVLAGLR